MMKWLINQILPEFITKQILSEEELSLVAWHHFLNNETINSYIMINGKAVQQPREEALSSGLAHASLNIGGKASRRKEVGR